MESLSELLLKIYENAQHGSPPDFNEFALKSIKKTLHFDSGSLIDYGIVNQHDVVMQTIHIHQVPIEKLHDRLAVAGQESLNPDGTLVSRDVVLKAAFANRGRSVFAAVDDHFKNDMLDYCRKYETAHTLVLASTAKSGRFSLGALWRADRKRPYCEADAHLASQIMPHVFEARKINARTLPGARMPAATGGAPIVATVLASFDGRIYFVDSTAIALIQREWKEWSPPLLPPPLIDILRQGRRAEFFGRAIAVRATLQGDLLCLAISAMAEQNSLTNAELRVATLAAEGLQYKEIAKRLTVSPATVRNHLHTIYKKLGISNKTSLTHALSQNAQFPV